MSDTRIRPRFDPTALHKSGVVDTNNTTSIVKLDIVASKVTIIVPDALVVDIEGSIDGSNYFTIQDGASSDSYSYGSYSTDNLVKYIKITYIDGSGYVTIAATQ